MSLLTETPVNKIKCQHLVCDSESTYFWENHKKAFCARHKNLHHSECKFKKILDIDELKENLTEAKKILEEFIKFSDTYELASHIDGLKEEIERSAQLLQKLETEIDCAVQKELFHQFSNLDEEITKFHSDFNNTVFMKVALFKLREEISNDGELLTKYSKKYSAKQILDPIPKKILIHGDMEAHEEPKASLNKIDDYNFNFDKDSKEDKNEQYNLKIKELEDTIFHLEKEGKQRETIMNELEEYNNMFIKPCFKQIVDRLKGETSNYNPDFALFFDFREEEHKKLLVDLSALQIRIPDIRKIVVYTLPVSDDILKYFFEYYSPKSLDLLQLNDRPDGFIDIDYYLDSLINSFESVKDEVYLNKFKISGSSLSKIIKASSQCKRLVLWLWDISTNSSLDFDTGGDYKIKYLSFYALFKEGSYHHWDKNPNEFEDIVKAISNSKLKDSLDNVNVLHSIKKDKAQEILNSYDLNHIAVIGEDNHASG